MKKTLILVTGLLVGFLLSSQYIAYKRVNDFARREGKSNIFSEIQFHKKTTEALDEEVQNLENQKKQISDKYSAEQGILESIKNDQILAGEIRVKGQGIKIKIQKSISAIWLVDLANELWTAGAEAISVNGIRLVNKGGGFEDISRQQVMLNGILLSAPLEISAIGDKLILKDALSQAGGLIVRLKSSYSDIEIEIEEKEYVIL